MAVTVKQRQFDKELEALRSLIQSAAKPFPDDKTAQKARKERASRDLLFFGQTYFPHYTEAPPSELHRYFCEKDPQMIIKAIETGEGDRAADAAPRGNAKSTWRTLILPLWCIVLKYRHFILPVSETALQSQDFLSFIKLELETNERLSQDYPEACGVGPVWRADTIITRNGCKVRGAGAGQKLRGMRHGAKRPDLVIGDDLENDEAVESPDQRKKLEKWFFKALMKIGQPDTVYIVVGTILHYDSLLNGLLKKPGWKGRKFKSVIAWSKSKLWDRWEAIFSDVTLGKEEAESKADAFFEAHRSEMLAGTKVLWPERESYYYLMKMRVSEGHAYFDSEKQNEPINPEDCLFREEDLVFWGDEDSDVDLTGIPLYGTLDPSLGKKSKRHDPSAIVAGRYKGGRIYLEIGDIEKRVPDKIINDVLDYHERDQFRAFGVEAVQFQEFFATSLVNEAHRRNLTLNVVQLRPHIDKMLRIQTLQPWIKNGWIVFKRHMRALIDQLIHYPMGDHDDGPDALEQLKSLIEAALARLVYKDCWSDTLLFDELPHGLSASEGYAERYIGVVYGTTLPVVFLDIRDDGRVLWVAGEYYRDPVSEGSQKTDGEHADDLLAFVGNADATIILNPEAASFKAELRSKGLYVKDADMNLLDGIRLVSSMFGRRMIRIHQACSHVIQEHRSYMWDPDKARTGVEEPMIGPYPTCDTLRLVVKTKIKPWRLAA
jgi:predicted phage terminase large subunit-like protein